MWSGTNCPVGPATKRARSGFAHRGVVGDADRVRREVRVAERHLWADVAEDGHERFEAHAAVDEGGGVGVSELVGVDVSDAGVDRGELQVVAEPSGAHPFPVDDPHEVDRSVGSGMLHRSAGASVSSPFVEGCEGGFVDGDGAFGVEFADRDTQPGAVVVVVGEAVEFEVQEFAGSQAGAAQNSDRAACGDVVEFVDGGHQVAVGVGGQRSGDGGRDPGKVAAMEQWSWRPLGPTPQGDVFEEGLQRRHGSVLTGDRHGLTVAASTSRGAGVVPDRGSLRGCGGRVDRLRSTSGW